MLLVLAAGAFYDVREHRIPNWWVVSAIVCGILVSVLEADLAPVVPLFVREGGLFLCRMAAVTALFFPLFRFRMIGAGDVKLAALICGYAGFSGGAAAIGLGFLIGAVWSFFKMVLNKSLRTRICYFTAYIGRIYHTKKITAYYDLMRDGTDAVIPLGLCLFLGTIISLVVPG